MVQDKTRFVVTLTLLIVVALLFDVFAIVGDFFVFIEKSIGPSDVVNVIFETDMAMDVDDAGALAMLHALADNGEAKILAVMHGTSEEYSVGCIDAINTYYGRPDIRIGSYKGDLYPEDGGYARLIAENFPNDLVHKDRAPDAIELYRDILEEQPDNSVTIISVGFLINLYDLLQQYPHLVQQKVKSLVVMGGYLPMGTEFNFCHGGSGPYTQYVIENWPTEIIFTDYNIGVNIYTGAELGSTPPSNPVREAYFRYHGGRFQDRHSWDQTAVLVGVRGLSDYWSTQEDEGYMHVRYDCFNEWKYDLEKEHDYLVELMPRSEIEDVIESLMIQKPAYKNIEQPIHGKYRDPLTNLALLSEAVISSSVPPGTGRETPYSILFNPAKNDYEYKTNWNEHGVDFGVNLGKPGEDDPFYWMVEWPEEQLINYITFGGTYPFQGQPFTMWKVQYFDEDWITLEEGQGGWIDGDTNPTIFEWGGPSHPIIKTTAVRVIAYSDGIHDLVSIHLRGRGGESNNEDDRATFPKATLIQLI